MKHRKLISLTALGVLATCTVPAFGAARPSEHAELVRHDLDMARSYVVRGEADALSPWPAEDRTRMEALAREDLRHAEMELEIAESAAASSGSGVPTAALPATAVETAIEQTRALEAAPSAPGARREFRELRHEIWTLLDDI